MNHKNEFSTNIDFANRMEQIFWYYYLDVYLICLKLSVECNVAREGFIECEK